MAMARLIVAFGTQEFWDIIGDEESMRSQYVALRDIVQTVDGVHERFFELTGFRNLADRRSEQMLVRVEDIKAVSLQET